MTLSVSKLAQLQELTAKIVEREVAPLAETVDRDCRWPAHSMQALANAGVTALNVPTAQGGHGQGLLALSTITAEIARACPSSALCFGMHCVATAVIASKATHHQQKHYLEAIARGEHITSLALSETGSGTHFYLPATQMLNTEQGLVLRGEKQFVTSGGHADSYVVSVASQESGLGDFSCLVVDADTRGMEWQEPWRGFGMRGNSSRAVRFEDAPMKAENLLGELGDQVWYVFEVVAPYFLMAMAGSYMGIAEAAVAATRDHLSQRRHRHSGATLAEQDVLQARVAEMWMTLERNRSFIREAAQRGDLNDEDALPFLLSAKVAASEAAVQLANEAMSLCGGMAYRDNSRVAQMLRDARASHVMAPTTELLKLWTGRSLLGQSML